MPPPPPPPGPAPKAKSKAKSKAKAKRAPGTSPKTDKAEEGPPAIEDSKDGDVENDDDDVGGLSDWSE